MIWSNFSTTNHLASAENTNYFNCDEKIAAPCFRGLTFPKKEGRLKEKLVDLFFVANSCLHEYWKGVQFFENDILVEPALSKHLPST